MALDPTQRFEPEPAPDAVKAFGVYANYDGNAPDSSFILFVASEEITRAILPIVRERHNGICFIDGWEGHKSWTYGPTRADRDQVCCTLAEAIESLGEPEEPRKPFTIDDVKAILGDPDKS